MAGDGAEALKVFLTAEWRDLAMLNYAVDPAIVEPLVPPGTEIDFFNGQTYVSLVGFRFLRTRLLGMRIPLHQDFPEVNLRFYVRRGNRRGVVFIREIVPRHAIAALGRLAYAENYIALPMSCRVDSGSVEYRWRHRQRWNSILVEAAGNAACPEPGTIEQFIAEHYWGYSASREYRVEHEPWRVRTAVKARFEGDATPLYGPAFSQTLVRDPDSAFVAEGSAVTVFQPGWI
jgi:uncharacterized protein YqjF (DUF2071 family)